jgi:hypothetical protein
MTAILMARKCVWLTGLGGVTVAALCHETLCPSTDEWLGSGVRAWWGLLCAIAIINACTWHRQALLVVDAVHDAPMWVRRFQRRQLCLSAVFVFGCAFRSLFPRADIQRLGLVDSWLSSVIVGRSVATAAELCFIVQWALLLDAFAWHVRSPFGLAVARLVVPLIVVAEVASWSAVLTTCYLGNVIEETIWAVVASLLVISCLVIWARSPHVRGLYLAAALLLGAAYVAFMCAVDIPMYVSRWQADCLSGRPYFDLSQGLIDAWSRRVVTFSWDEWQTEIPWMTLYFSVCVWRSLALVHAPRLTLAPGEA